MLLNSRNREKTWRGFKASDALDLHRLTLSTRIAVRDRTRSAHAPKHHFDDFSSDDSLDFFKSAAQFLKMFEMCVCFEISIVPPAFLENAVVSVEESQ